MRRDTGKRDRGAAAEAAARPLLSRRQLDLLQAVAEANQAAALAILVAVRPDAPGDAVVAVHPGAVADALARGAGDRHGLLLAGLEQPDLVVARPDPVAVLAEHFHRQRIPAAVLHIEQHF